MHFELANIEPIAVRVIGPGNSRSDSVALVTLRSMKGERAVFLEDAKSRFAQSARIVPVFMAYKEVFPRIPDSLDSFANEQNGVESEAVNFMRTQG